MSRAPNFPPTNSSQASTYHQFPYCVDLFVHAHAGSKPPGLLAAAQALALRSATKLLGLSPCLFSPTCPTALTTPKRLVKAPELRPIRAGSKLRRACVVARLPITTFAVPSAALALSNRSQQNLRLATAPRADRARGRRLGRAGQLGLFHRYNTRANKKEQSS